MDARGRRGQSLPKLDVAGSSPVARSLNCFPRSGFGPGGGTRLEPALSRSNVSQ